MNLDLVRWPLLAVTGGLVVAAVIAGPNEATAVAVASLAALTVSGFAGLSMMERTRFRRRTFVLPESDSLVGLRQAFREGPIGRQRIAAAVAELERGGFGRRDSGTDAEMVLRPERQDAARFRRWVEERVDDLERST